tara:strand:- start:140 stop:484 length:345 start_codon:yes stop_codon:yes gene_type:complete
MATFPSITPSYGANQQNNPKTRVSSMGDGYEIRVNVGLNQNPKQWALRWQNISETDADTISAFLDNRASDGASFDWTPPDTTTSYKWVCASWTKSIPYLNRATISATFRQVFEA